MATTKSRAKPSQHDGASESLTGTVKEATSTAAEATRRARGPLVAAGAATAGLAGGLALGSRRRGRRRLLPARRRRVLGVPVGRRSGALRAAELLRDGAKQLNSATGQVAGTREDVRQIREQLEKVNRRSPLEVLLDGLTHRRGVHRNES